MAQQVPVEERKSIDNEKLHDLSFGNRGFMSTFRPWNPEKQRVGLKDSTLPDDKRQFTLCGCCPCAILVNSVFDSALPEVIHEVVPEPLKKEEIFSKLQKSNSTRTNLLRLVGFFLMWIGITMLFSPIVALVAWIPFVGFLIAQGVSFIASIVALVLATLFFTLTVGIAWIFYRPLFGLFLIVTAATVTGFILLGMH